MKESAPSPSARQVRAARTLLGLTQAQLASLAGLATRTVENFESESGAPPPFTVLALKVALECAGVAFAGPRPNQ